MTFSGVSITASSVIKFLSFPFVFFIVRSSCSSRAQQFRWIFLISAYSSFRNLMFSNSLAYASILKIWRSVLYSFFLFIKSSTSSFPSKLIPNYWQKMFIVSHFT